MFIDTMYAIENIHDLWLKMSNLTKKVIYIYLSLTIPKKVLSTRDIEIIFYELDVFCVENRNYAVF